MHGSSLAGIAAIAASVAMSSSRPAAAQETTRVSVDSGGVQGNYDCYMPKLSSDGRFVVFSSLATNLVTGDSNAAEDVFVHDRSTGLIERSSVDSTGAEGNGDCFVPSITADGEVVGFTSLSTNLVPGDVNGWMDAFVHERSTGLTECVSVSSSGALGNWPSHVGGISSDGTIASFASVASNLAPGDLNGLSDVFVRDRSTGSTERVSVDSNGVEGKGGSEDPVISSDGVIVAFWSNAANLVSGDTNASSDIFVHDRSTRITECVSVDSSGVQGNGLSLYPAISADGRFVAFESIATNLVPGDTNGCYDVFVHDRVTGTTERASVDSSGAQAGGDSRRAALSPDGRIVAFHSAATDLVTGDNNGKVDVFLRDRSSATTVRVSVDSSGAEGDGDSDFPAVATGAIAVAFASTATALVPGDTNGKADAFVHEPCSTPASWLNYGNGFPGTFGVPSFNSRQNPVLGSTITLDLANSWQQPTAGLLFIGFQRASIHSGWGGDLLVVPVLTQLITFSFGFDSFSGGIPSDGTLCGFTIDLQALESDPGAAKGISFTQGLELVLGL
jgi:hypothetical protein